MSCGPWLHFRPTSFFFFFSGWGLYRPSPICPCACTLDRKKREEEENTHMCSAILRMLRRKKRFRPGGGVRGQPAVRAYKAVKSLFLDRTIRKENSRVKLLRGDGRERTDKTFQHHQSFCLIRSLPQIASLSLSVANGSKVKRGEMGFPTEHFSHDRRVPVGSEKDKTGRGREIRFAQSFLAKVDLKSETDAGASNTSSVHTSSCSSFALGCLV